MWDYAEGDTGIAILPICPSAICHSGVAVDFFARGLRTHTVVMRLDLHQLGFLVTPTHQIMVRNILQNAVI